MTGITSDDALSGQQSRIMNAMRAQAQPSQQQIAPQDLLQAIVAGNSGNGASGYFDTLKQNQSTQAQNNVAAETGIYTQMKEQVARGNTDAAAVDKAITDVAGDDPKIYASIAQDLHNDPEKVTPANARSKVMKYAAEQGINPLSNQTANTAVQEAQAKIALTKAQTSEAQANAAQANANAGIFTGGAPGAPGVPGAPAAIDMSLRGDDYLKQLNPEIADRAKALIKGDLPYPSGFMMKQDPVLKAGLAAALHSDPNYNYATATTRKKMMEDMLAGSGSKELATLNMTLGHISDLKDAQENLHNKGNRVWNAVTNAYGWATDDPNVAAYNANVSPLAEELTKAYRGSGGAESDVNRTINNLGINAGPQQQTAALQKTAKLLASKINSVALRYKKAMGSTDGFTDFIDPAGIKTLNDLGVVFDSKRGFIAGKPDTKTSSNNETPPDESIRTASEPIINPNVKASNSITMNGKSYINQNGKWYEK